MINVKEIEELTEFLALAYLLEEESADRYHELADNMEVHNNPEASALFRKLAEFGELHAAEVVELAGGA
ncbi:MAG: ferritin family protein, partial [Gammaproteobacteria bacterium]